MKERVIVIAEAGVNHNGNINIAKQLVDVAAEAGADIVKFQTFRTEKLVCKNAQKAEYQMKTSGTDESQFDMLKRLELSSDVHRELILYCKEKGIEFLSTAFDFESVDLLDSLGAKMFKIPSGEITNLPLLRKIASKKKAVILSTGMCTLDEVSSSVQILKEGGVKNITLLHCNSQYPTPMKDVNLKAMITMQDRFKLPIGYSDHTLGIEVPIAAVAMGASVIEKHFTLDRNMEGPDHQSSLLPGELVRMIAAIRNIEKAIGNGEKQVSISEQKNIATARKSIVAATSIKKGDIFTEDNLTTKRPGTGISPMRWDEIIGTCACKDYQEDDMIQI